MPKDMMENVKTINGQTPYDFASDETKELFEELNKKERRNV